MGACSEKHAPYDPSQDCNPRQRGDCSSACSGSRAPSEPVHKMAEVPDRSSVCRRRGRISADYVVDDDKVGAGAFGVVRKGTHKGTSMIRAVKTLSKKEMRNLKMFRQEIQIMKQLDHPNVVKLFETFEDTASIYLVMEFCSGGELFDRIIEAGRFDEGQTAAALQQILRAVHYLHGNMVVHRDLKPENFLLASASAPIEDNCLKLIDFGYACRLVPGRSLKTKAGTAFYMAPQVLTGRYDQLCDVWSCGVIMYVLLCGYPPFYGNTDREVVEKVRNGAYVFRDKDWLHVSEDAKDLIAHCLKRSPKERYTAQMALNHTWVTNLAPGKRSLDEVDGFHQSLISERMRRFRNKNRLKRAALRVIATQLSDRALKDLREMFLVLDANGDGTLCMEDIKQAVNGAGLEIPEDIEDLMSDADDMGGNGSIDYTEFLASMLEQRDYMVEGAVKTAFATFDAAGKGRIARKELAKILGVGHEDKTAVEDILREVDKDGDGNISFDEFMAMMQQTPAGDGEVYEFMCKTGSDGGEDTAKMLAVGA